MAQDFQYTSKKEILFEKVSDIEKIDETETTIEIPIFEFIEDIIIDDLQIKNYKLQDIFFDINYIDF